MRHVPMTRGDLIEVLSDMLAAVQANDSFEGSVEYLMPGPLVAELRQIDPCEHDTDGDGGCGRPACPKCAKREALDKAEFAVIASYRVGNSMGQGGVNMVGEMEDGPRRPDPLQLLHGIWTAMEHSETALYDAAKKSKVALTGTP